jgi:hypothetical protein
MTFSKWYEYVYIEIHQSSQGVITRTFLPRITAVLKVDYIVFLKGCDSFLYIIAATREGTKMARCCKV